MQKLPQWQAGSKYRHTNGLHCVKAFSPETSQHVFFLSFLFFFWGGGGGGGGNVEWVSLCKEFLSCLCNEFSELVGLFNLQFLHTSNIMKSSSRAPFLFIGYSQQTFGVHNFKLTQQRAVLNHSLNQGSQLFSAATKKPQAHCKPMHSAFTSKTEQ